MFGFGRDFIDQTPLFCYSKENLYDITIQRVIFFGLGIFDEAECPFGDRSVRVDVANVSDSVSDRATAIDGFGIGVWGDRGGVGFILRASELAGA